MDNESITDILLLRDTVFDIYHSPKIHDSMSPLSGEVVQTPEPKTSSGLASVFKSFTGSKSSRSPNIQSPASIAQKLNGTSTAAVAVSGGPPAFEQFYHQLKAGNSLSDRISAAEALRYAVQDYPLDGVCDLRRRFQGLSAD
jgi:hypothetical protein